MSSSVRTWLLALWLIASGTAQAAAAVGGAGDAAAPGAAPGGVIYVIRRGWHVDLGFSADALPRSMSPILAELPGARYVVFGFGDRRYLLARRKTAFRLIGALWPAPGLILATGLTTFPEAAFGKEHVLGLAVSAATARAAALLVRRSIDGADTMTPIAPGPYPGSVFYASVTAYSALNTCNTWVAGILRSSGLPVHVRGVLFAGQVWRQALRLARADVPLTRQWQGAAEPSEHTAVVP